MGNKSEEVNYKKDFCIKYFDRNCWELDTLHQVDVLLKTKKGKALLYIESKDVLQGEGEYRKALAHVILTNKKQDAILDKVALIYRDSAGNDYFELIDCSDNSIMYNNDINWKEEKASNPSKDAVDRINDRIKNHIRRFANDEIFEIYANLKKGSETVINITENNFNVVFNQWKNAVEFIEEIPDEQDLINLFLADLLNNTRYKKSVMKDKFNTDLFGSYKIGQIEEDSEANLIREGTNLYRYEIVEKNNQVFGIVYLSNKASLFYRVKSIDEYYDFWNKYKRPPEKHEFLKILERSATLYTDRYRRDTGGEYTPSCFVEKQNELLEKHYGENWKDEYIVCDVCAGVGNLENQFGKDYKDYCYLSTLEQMDVDICRIKGFENAIRFDYLKDDSQPKWKYKGTELDITEIARRENRKLMIVINPPYKRKVGFKHDLAIEFFNKIVKLKPDVIVYYCKTEFFLRDTVSNYAESGYKIKSHIFSNAKDTFLLSEWSVSQIIFDKENGEAIDEKIVKADRYELEKEKLVLKGTYTYDSRRPDLIKEIENKIKDDTSGMIFGQWCYLNSVLKISNGGKEKNAKITTNNLKWCLLSKGLNFNTHHHYFEWNYLVYKGKAEDIPKELFNDAICFSLFYKGFLFTNKGQKNYIMPFTAEELGCCKNDLNVLFPEKREAGLFDEGICHSEMSHCHSEATAEESPKKVKDVSLSLNMTEKTLNMTEKEKPEHGEFDFRVWLRQFEFSQEAKDLYNAALKIFKYYHNNEEYQGKDWNDSFYDITNAIMGKNPDDFDDYQTDNDTRITKTKTTKGTKGFGRNTVKYAVGSEHLPIFEVFFDSRDILAKKINRQLVDSGLLLWERENIY